MKLKENNSRFFKKSEESDLFTYNILKGHVFFLTPYTTMSTFNTSTHSTSRISLTPAPFNASYVLCIPISGGTKIMNPSRPRVSNTRSAIHPQPVRVLRLRSFSPGDSSRDHPRQNHLPNRQWGNPVQAPDRRTPLQHHGVHSRS